MSERKLIENFETTTSPAARRAQGNATVLSALSTIEARAGRTRQIVLDHYKKFEDRWVGKETIRLHQKHLERMAIAPAPPIGAKAPTAEMFARQAAHNVRARVNARLTKVASIKTRMTNAVTRSLEPQPLRHSFHPAAENTLPKLKLQQSIKR